MENKKGSLSTAFLVIAIILIIVMGVFMYMQKTESDRQIAELENSINEIKNNGNELPNSGEVNLLVSKFLEMIYEPEGSFEGTLEIIGYDNSEQIYNNTKDSYNNGDSIKSIYDNEYSNTKIKYSDFEEKISNYMTPQIVKECFGGRFVEHNGDLYANLIRTSGARVSNVTSELLSENSYSVKYVLDVSGETEQHECIIKITKNNNKNVVSGFME